MTPGQKRAKEPLRSWADLRGPACPVCGRNDWSHVEGCSVQSYYNDWKRIFNAEADRIIAEVCER